ncbi:MAG TPA: CPBP family glutamic-type intramembrane protease [Pyrinomonadaceae bacterium]|jgi:membrane protease YdiL (CAAX protease family)|nr:CPBP family glutamic-type intramembrane protease [Pyrinomonadaceae bacterium]
MMSTEDKKYDGIKAARADERALAGWEIVSVTTSFLIAAWLILPFTGNDKVVWAIPIIFAFILMLASHRARKESAREVGWRLDNFGEALRLLIIPVLCVALLIFLAAWWMGSLRLEGTQFRPRFLLLPAWGFVQQYVMQGFINRRAQILWGRGWPSVLLVGLVFGLLHLPNLWLTAVTFLGGVILAYIYQRVPNLLALALAHGLVSLLLVSSLPPTALHSMRVGFKYFQ